MSKVIAQMVGRNEADRFLVDVLMRLRSQVDMIIFTDDASVDSTPSVAETFGAKVVSLDEPLFAKNEGELRSKAWAHLERYAEPGDTILAADCDELFYGFESLPALLDQSQYDVFGVQFFHMWSNSAYRIDKAWLPNYGSRLFRFVPGGRFPQRKLACGSEPDYVGELIRQGKVLWDSGIKCKHLGYLRDEDKIAKYKRYSELDGGDYHSLAHIESITDPHPVLAPWEFG